MTDEFADAQERMTAVARVEPTLNFTKYRDGSYLTPETVIIDPDTLRRWIVTRIKMLAFNTIPKCELPADSFIERAALDIIEMARRSRAD
jgi:hypothetical protein